MGARQTALREQQVRLAIRRAGLPDVRVECDRDGTAYLNGTVQTSQDKGAAVQAAIDAGAPRVFEGLVLGDQHAGPMERHFVIVPTVHAAAAMARSPEQKLLGSADLSHRLFDCLVSHGTTGTSLTVRS